MGIDAKVIQHLLWRIIRFSGACCHRFVRKYPVVSGVFVFVFFLYISFPSVFYFLMYSSPVTVCTFVWIRFYFRTKYPEFKWFKRKNGDQRSSVDVNRSNNPSLRSQKSVRRNVRKEVVEWDRKVPTSLYDSLSSNTNFLEENSKLIFDEKEWTSKGRTSMEHGESSSHNEIGNDRALDGPNLLSDDGFQGQSGRGPDDGGGGASLVEAERMEEGEDEEEEEEEVQEDRNKAVEWTEDDQKNLMDLGALESERNRRLESLILKRRAKKLLKIAVDKSLMDMDAIPPSQLAPILIVKNSLFGFPNNSNGEGLQMPGSAPSILLPTQNPFDLPYDPFEEKPNLMADSFQQEFMAANQKEMLFCRHESFCRGTSFTHDPNDAQFNPYFSTQRGLVQGLAVPGLKWQPDNGGGHHQHNSSGIVSDIDLVELEDSNCNEAMNSSEGKHETIRESAMDGIKIEGEKMKKPNHDLEPGLDSRNEVKVEMDSINNNDSCYSSSSEDTESVLDQTSKAPGIRNDQMREALNLLIPPKGKTVNILPYDSSPSPSERRRTDFNLFYSTYRRHCHTPTRSIASDLQVEVSEVGSPPLTTDGTVSSVDGDSVTYDGDVDRDINSDSEELWGGSFNLSRGEANREKLRELHDIIEEDSVEVELSDLNRKPEEPIASLSQSELETKQNLDSRSSLSSIIEMTENVASHSTNINPKTHENAEKTDEEVEGFKNFNVSDVLSPENPGKIAHLIEKSAVHSLSESCLQKPEQLIEPHQKPMEELNIICNVKPITQGDSSNLDSKSSENRENGAQILIETAGEMRKPDEAINLYSSEYGHRNLEKSYESKTTTESEKEMKVSQLAKYIEEDMTAQDDTQNLELEHSNGDASSAARSRDNIIPVPDSIFDHNVVENDFSGVKQRSGSSIATALNPRLLIEQMSVGSFSSPRSVLPQNFLEDQTPQSDVEQLIQTDEPKSAMEDIVRDGLADDEQQENLTFDMPQNAQQLVENSIDRSSGNSSLGTLEGSSNMIEKTTNYSSVDNTNEHVVEHTQGKEDSSIKAGEGELKTLMNLKDAKELSKPSTESNPGLIEHPEGGSEKLVEYDDGIDRSKSEEENAKSDDPETMVEEEEATNSPRKVIEEGNIVINIDNSEVDKKEEGEKLTTNEGESRFSIGAEAIRGLEKPNQEEADLNKGEANESQNLSIPESASEGEKSAAEVDLICDMNDSFANDVTNIKILNHHLDGEGEPQILSREAAVMEPSMATEATNAGSIEDTHHETERLTEADQANAGLSTSAGDSNSLNNIKNGEEIIGAPESKEDKLKAIERKVAIEPSKATGVTNAGSVEETEHETGRLTKAEANAGLSTSAGESNSLNNIKNGGQDGSIVATQSKDDDVDTIESKVAMEASKPTESEVEAVNPEGDECNSMAK